MINLSAIDFKDNKTRVLAAAALGLIFVLILYFNLLLKPQVIKIAKLITKANKVRAELKGAEADIAKIDQFKKEIEAYKGKVDSYEKTLPAEQEIPSFLENLSNMAKSSNIKIVAITPVVAAGGGGEAEKGIYQEIPILINAKSGYHELGRFLNKLETSDRFMKVADIDIKGNRDNPNKHDIELLVLTYILLKNK